MAAVERGDRRRGDRADRPRPRAAAVHVIDPLESLRPGGPNARTDGNVWGAAARRRRRASRRAPSISALKWTEARLRRSGRRPHADGQGDGGMGVRRSRRRRSRTPRSSLDETFVVQSTGHHPMETRSAMAYWQNGKLLPALLHAERRAHGRRASRAGSASSREDVVLICEYTGGGFGSKGGGAVSMAIPALLSKKANAPVMMRISREEESYIGRARTNMVGPRQGRLREGRPHHSRSISSSSRTAARTGRWAITARPATPRR